MYLIAVGLAVLFFSMVVVAVVTLTGAGEASSAEQDRAAQLRKLPSHWTVRRGDSYVAVARETGLTVDELETFNPYVNPSSIRPGQRLKLHRNPPKPAPKPKGPRTYTVRSGDSFESIATKTGRTVVRLQELNPKLKPTELQPGDRMRLRE